MENLYIGAQVQQGEGIYTVREFIDEPIPLVEVMVHLKYGDRIERVARSSFYEKDKAGREYPLFHQWSPHSEYDDR